MGALATIVDYCVFWLFDGVVFPLFVHAVGLKTLFLILATALGFCAGLLINWILSVVFVFRAVKNQEKIQSKKSFFIFTVIGVIGLLITELGILGLVAILPELSLFGHTEFLDVANSTWFAKIIMTIIVLIWNYVGRKLLVFKD